MYVAAEKPRRVPLQAVTQELRFSDLWPNHRRHLLLIVFAAVAGSLIGLLLTVRAPRLYTATATVELKQNNSGVGVRDFSGAATQIGTGPEFMLDVLTLQEVLTGEETELAVIQKLNLLSEPPYNRVPEGAQGAAYRRQMKLPLDQAPLVRDRALALFAHGLQVTPIKNTRLMTISYTDPDPTRASLIANTLVESYLSNYASSRLVATNNASALLADQLASLKKRVEATHQEVSGLEQSTGLSGAAPLLQSNSANGFNPDAYDSPAYQRLKALNAEMTRVEIVRLAKESIYRMTQTDDPEVILQVSGARLSGDGASENTLGSAGRSIQLIQSLHAQEAALRLRLAALQVTYGAENPLVVESKKQVDAIHDQIKDEILSVRKAAKMEFLLATSTENALRQRVALQQQTVGDMSAKVARLAFLQQEENTNRSLYQSLYTRLEEANVAAGVKSAAVSVTAPARPPSRPSSPNLRYNLLAGLAGGALLGYIVVLFLKLREGSPLPRQTAKAL